MSTIGAAGTRNGRAAAVIISPDDLAELEETVAVLSDAAALADILSRIDDEQGEIVFRVPHRSEAYRPL